MSEGTKIEWCDYTFNPWIGCTKVSPGCANCYAESQDKFRSWTPEGWGKGKPRKRTTKANWQGPRKWQKKILAAQLLQSEQSGFGSYSLLQKPRVFCASLADWLDAEVPVEWLVDLLSLIEDTQGLDWLLLTKRPENWELRMLLAHRMADEKGLTWICQLLENWLHGDAPENVWIGTSVEDQRRADERVPELIQIPAVVRFLSVEPMLGPVDLSSPRLATCGVQNNFVSPGCLSSGPLHWVICGGESGPGARPFALEWADDLRRQCESSGAAFFMKQIGARPYLENVNLWSDGYIAALEACRCLVDPPAAVGGAASAGITPWDKKGGDVNQWPPKLRVRKFPNQEGLSE